MRTFYVFHRGKRKNLYVQFAHPITGRLQSALSTGKSTREEAIEEAYRMLYTSPAVKKQINPIESMQLILQSQNLSRNELDQLRAILNMGEMNESAMGQFEGSQSISQVPQQAEPIAPQSDTPDTPTTPLTQWLKDFWNFETSDYVQDKIAHGKRVGQRYCSEQTNIIKYWEEYFTLGFSLEELTSKHLELFEKHLWEKEIQKKRTVENPDTGKKFVEIYTTKLSTTTRNNIIKCASIAFEWAVRKHIMSENPCKSLTAYSIKAKERGILDRKEVSKLFTVGKWKDEKAKVASLVGATTGIRISEILALQKDDIGDDRLYISKSWNSKDGLTTTKNGESRIVPLVPKVKTALLKLCLQNPHKDAGDSFIFWGTLPNKPIVSNMLTDDFKSAMESIGISETMRQRRNIVFHSWRHFYATIISTELSQKHAQLTLGHLTEAMTKHYADHKTEEALLAVCDASNDIFTSMLG